MTESGRPYLVMEYVDGRPITEYCDHHRLGLPARLRLFADVCAAVQHAHQSLVIHRDLKPANILISADGRVHLLDFGIAKLLNPPPDGRPSPRTVVESRMMTPEYASPEQVLGEPLTTASDIYSLGVLLYEILCGHRPYRIDTHSPAAVASAVCEQDPPRPSVRAGAGADREEAGSEATAAAGHRATSVERLVRSLEGDLDSIVGMAMRKEAGRRYASADMLRQDIERHLGGLPVLAHRGSRRYRFGKFVRRHRIEVLATASVALALVIGLGAALQQGARASRERNRAERALAESSGVSSFLLDLFQSGDTGHVPASQLSALDLLERGARRAGELSDQPTVHSRLLDVIGQMSLHLGRLEESQRTLEQAVAIRRSLTGASAELASSLIHLSWVHRVRNEFDAARALVNEALEIRRATLPEDHPDVADALYELGWLAFGSEQERLYRQALAILPDTPQTTERRIVLLQALSTNLRRQGRFDEVVALDREALVTAERSLGPDHHATGYAMIHLGDHIRDLEQDGPGAERLYRRGLDLMARHHGDNSLRLIHGLNSLAALLADRGDDEAESHYRRALAISRSATGDNHLRVADQLHRLGGELARQGRLADAEQLARQALEISIDAVGPRHQVVTTSRLPFLAGILDRQRRHGEADETYREAFARVQRPSNVMVGQMHREYGLMLLRRGEHGRAEKELLSSMALLEQSYGGPAHPNAQETRRALMELYRRTNQPHLVERYRVPPGRFVPY